MAAYRNRLSINTAIISTIVVRFITTGFMVKSSPARCGQGAVKKEDKETGNYPNFKTAFKPYSYMDITVLNGNIPGSVYSGLPAVIAKYGIDDALKLAHFLGQCDYESEH